MAGVQWCRCEQVTLNKSPIERTGGNGGGGEGKWNFDEAEDGPSDSQRCEERRRVFLAGRAVFGVLADRDSSALAGGDLPLETWTRRDLVDPTWAAG